MIVSTLIKDSLNEKLKLKTEVSSEVLKQMVAADALAFANSLNSEIDLAKINAAKFYFFKNKRELEIVLNDGEKAYVLKTTFVNLSPGYGLREKVIDLTPSEGIYFVDQPGFQKTSGFFVKVQYPPESYKKYQKLEYEALKNETYMIAEKAIGASFIQVESAFMKFFIHLVLKLEKDKLKLLVYPDRPPLTMELGGTEFTSEIYKNLDIEYKKLTEIYESLKPKY